MKMVLAPSFLESLSWMSLSKTRCRTNLTNTWLLHFISKQSREFFFFSLLIMKEAITSLRFSPHSCQECCLPTTPDHCWWTRLLIMIHFPPTAQTFCCPNHSCIPKFNTLFFCLLWNTTWEMQWLTAWVRNQWWWVRNPHFYKNTEEKGFNIWWRDCETPAE